VRPGLCGLSAISIWLKPFGDVTHWYRELGLIKGGMQRSKPELQRRQVLRTNHCRSSASWGLKDLLAQRLPRFSRTKTEKRGNIRASKGKQLSAAVGALREYSV